MVKSALAASYPLPCSPHLLTAFAPLWLPINAQVAELPLGTVLEVYGDYFLSYVADKGYRNLLTMQVRARSRRFHSF